jgi:hypothetical protein
MSQRIRSSLAEFQDAFAAGLAGEVATLDADMAALAAQPGFAVYRNGVAKHAADAVAANFPAVSRWVGEEWFRAAAAAYARTEPPRSPILLEYGDGFPRFLQHFPPAVEIDHVAALARLDRMWTEAHIAPDDPVLDPARIADLSPQALGRVVLQPHASARWAWFEDGPIFTLWSRNRYESGDFAEIAEQAEGALIVRPHDSVASLALDCGECAFLDCCAAGGTLADAACAALDAAAATDLQHLMQRLLAAGAFARMVLRPESDTEV